MGSYTKTVYRVELGEVCGTVIVTGDVITGADPVLEKFIGARIKRFKAWIERKGGTVRANMSSLGGTRG